MKKIRCDMVTVSVAHRNGKIYTINKRCKLKATNIFFENFKNFYFCDIHKQQKSSYDYYELSGQAILRERFLDFLGVSMTGPHSPCIPGPDILRQTEKSDLFDTLRMNRKIMGALRYGLFSAKNKRSWNRLAAMENKIKSYILDGNDEHLLDIANYAELEFVEGNHPKKHFRAFDDGGGHCLNL